MADEEFFKRLVDGVGYFTLFILLGVWARASNEYDDFEDSMVAELWVPLIAPLEKKFLDDAVTFTSRCVRVPVGKMTTVMTSDLQWQYGSLQMDQPTTIKEGSAGDAFSIYGAPLPYWADSIPIDDKDAWTKGISYEISVHGFEHGTREFASVLLIQSCDPNAWQHDFEVSTGNDGTPLVTITISATATSSLSEVRPTWSELNITSGLFDALQVGTEVTVLRASAGSSTPQEDVLLTPGAEFSMPRPWINNPLFGIAQPWLSLLVVLLWCCTGPLQPELITPHLAAFVTFGFGATFISQYLVNSPLPGPLLVVLPFAIWPLLSYCCKTWLGALTLDNVSIPRTVLEFVATVQLAVLINVPSPFDLATAFVIESA